MIDEQPNIGLFFGTTPARVTFPLGHTEHTDHALVHNPRRTLSGSLTLALTWGIFGLLTGRVSATATPGANSQATPVRRRAVAKAKQPGLDDAEHAARLQEGVRSMTDTGIIDASHR